MPLDPRARRLLTLIEAFSGERDGEVEALRRATNALVDFAAPPPPVDRFDISLDLAGRSLAARVYAPPGAEGPLAGLVWLHGGGLVSGGLDSHDALMAELAAAARCRVVAVAYRLAPEHRFPAAHDDALEALEAIYALCAELAIDPARFAVGGDSAGGGLAALAVQRTAAPVKLLFLLCPVLDPLARERSRFELASGHLIEEATMRRYWALYRDGTIESDDSSVAPLRAQNFAAYPPTRIHTAEFDPLKDEGAALARAIAAAGKPASLVEHAGLIHHFYGLTGVIPAARAALEKIGADLADGLAP